MAFTVGIVLFFVGLLIVILIHELGHYAVARRFGFKVVEYFVGFGPKLWSTKRGEIEYGVKAIPAGGYVKIAGMNPYEVLAPEDLPRAYGSKPIWQRALVIFAGPGVHFILAAVLFAATFMLAGDPGAAGTPRIDRVVALNGQPSPAMVAGLQPGDEIVGVDALRDPSPSEMSDYVTRQARAGSSVRYTIERDGRLLTQDISPVLSTVEGRELGRVGIVISTTFPTYGPVKAAVEGTAEVGTSIATSVQQIGRVFGPEGVGRVFRLVFTGAQRQPEDPSSVVGIGRAVGETGAAGDFGLILYFLAFVTVFLGLVNLIPLPPFDGGHLAVLAIEKIRGKTVDMRRVIPVAVVVMAFFIGFVLLTVFADIKDIAR